MKDNLLRVYHMVNETEALGPGKLFGLWTQGCPRRCPGCGRPRVRPRARERAGG